MLVSHGAVVDAQDCDGNSPLHKAIWKGNLAIVEFLLNSGTPTRIWLWPNLTDKCIGANVLLRNNYGYCPFHLSTLLNDLRCTQLIISIAGIQQPTSTEGEPSTSTSFMASSVVQSPNNNKRRESDVVDTDFQPPKKTNIRLPFEPKPSTESFDLVRYSPKLWLYLPELV